MLALWDTHPQLPFKAWAPWPKVEPCGYQDWDLAVELVDHWLTNYIGSRWVDWTWGWGTFNMNLDYNQCCVNFRRQQSTSLFLLKFSS